VVGALGGALLGSAIAGHGDKTAGAVIGGVGGAVVGSSIAASNGRCPSGYVAVAEPPPPAPPPAYGYAGPAPSVDALHVQQEALRRRIDVARDRGRIDRAQADAAYDELHRIQDREGDLRDRHGGRLTADDRFYLQARLDHLSGTVREERVAGGPPPPPAPPTQVTLWVGAPAGLGERANWLQSRITADGARGILTPGGVREAQDGLNGFRNEEAALRSRDGGALRDTDRQYLGDRLEYLGQRVAWMESVHR
jgi:hypothetical protein